MTDAKQHGRVTVECKSLSCCQSSCLLGRLLSSNSSACMKELSWVVRLHVSDQHTCTAGQLTCIWLDLQPVANAVDLSWRYQNRLGMHTTPRTFMGAALPHQARCHGQSRHTWHHVSVRQRHPAQEVDQSPLGHKFWHNH